MTSRQTLSAEARRLAAIVASSDDAIIGKDLNGIVSSWNPGAEGLFGYTAAEMIGQPITRLIPPERQADEVRILDRIRRGERVEPFDTQRRTKDGRLIDVCVTVSPIKDPDGRIIGASKVARDISRRKRTDEALRYERDRAQQYLDTAGVILLALDMQGRITLVNRYACNVLGWTAEELLGRDFIDVCVPAAIRSETRDKLREVHAGDDSVVENPIVTRGGDERLIEWRTAHLHDGAGRVTGTLSSGSDITDRKRAQAAVREERDRAQRYLDTAEVILLALDVDGRITLINRKGCDVLGRCEAELLGRKWVDTCIPPRHRPLLAERFENLIAGDVSLIENPILGKDGQERMVEWRNRLLRDDAGRVVGTLSSGGDITERHAAIEALRIAEERMRFALQYANVGIWDLDYATGVLRWSETLEGQYGLRPGTFRGTFDAFMELVHPDDRPALRETIEAAMKSGAEFSVRNRSLARDGKVRWLTGAGRVLLGDDGQPLRGVGISLDVTAHRTLEEQYYQAQKMEAVGRLAGGVAHDFNNLLTVILGYCDLLLDERGEDAPDRSEILEIQKAGANAVSLVRQLLAFSRKQIIQPTLIDLNAVVENMRGMLGRLIGEDVRVVVTLSPDLSKVKADQGQLEQIVMNLAVNARDAMPRGGTLTIETAEVELDEDYAKAHLGAKPGSYVALTITDTGTRVVAREWWSARFGSTQRGNVAAAWVEGGAATAGRISLRVAWTNDDGQAQTGKQVDRVDLPPDYADLSVRSRANVVVAADGDGLAIAWRTLIAPTGKGADTGNATHPPRVPFAATLRSFSMSPDKPARLVAQYPVTVQPLGGTSGIGLWGLDPGSAWSLTLEGKAVFLWLDPARSTEDSLVAARLGDREPTVLVGDSFRTLWVPRAGADDRSAVVYGYRWSAGLRALEIRCSAADKPTQR